MASGVPDPDRSLPMDQLFSLKEWMVAISAKLDKLETKLDTKADVQQVQSIDVRIGVLEKHYVEGRAERDFVMPQHVRMLEDVGVLKTKAAAIDSVESYRRWVWGTVFISMLAFVLSAITIFGKL